SPGERAPDAALRVGDAGRPTSLFEVFRGTSHVLLLLEGLEEIRGATPFAGIRASVHAQYGDLIADHLVLSPARREAPSDWPGSILSDPTGELHRRYGATGP